MSNIIESAKELLTNGFSVFACKGETAKNKKSNKSPSIKSWEGYQQERMPEHHVDLLIKDENYLGVVCGKISGNLECIDFDNHLGNIDEVFKEYMNYEDVRMIVQTYGLFIEKTQSGGRHLVYRCYDPIPAGTNLAMDYDKEGKVKCIIETRGEGQYFVAVPSTGYMQTYPPTNTGKSLKDVGTISWEERQCLIDLACSFGKVIEQKKIISPPKLQQMTGVASSSSLRPGEAFNNDPNSIEDVKNILLAEGWTQSRTDEKKWVRPGKSESDGISATLGTLEKHPNSLYVFTSNAYPLQQGGLYSPFALMTTLLFNGDWKQCAKALRERGYGNQEIANNYPTAPREDGKDFKSAYRMAFDVIKQLPTEQYSEEDIEKIAKAGKLTNDEAIKIITKLIETNKHLIGHDNELTDIAKARRFVKNFYQFRRNVVKDELIITEKSANGTFTDKVSFETVYIRLKEEMYKINMSDLDALFKSAYTEEFNEIEDYFTSLPDWDESHPDYISMYANCFQCYDKELQPYFVDMFKKHIVRHIRCALGNIENRYIFILGGGQDTGKTSFIRNLCPLDDYFIESNPVALDIGRRSVALSTNFIWNIEEIDSYNQRERAILKDTVSKQNDRYRRVFTKTEKTHLRVANFWGTTNKDEFLTDETGNTRYIVFMGEIVSFDYSNKETGVELVPIDKLWAQAYALYKSKDYNCNLNHDEKIFQTKANTSYEVRNSIDELILKHFRPAEPMNRVGVQNSNYFFSNADIEIFLQAVAPRMQGVQSSIEISTSFKRINKRFKDEKLMHEMGAEYLFVAGKVGNSRGRYLQPCSPESQNYLNKMHNDNYSSGSLTDKLNQNKSDEPF